MSDRKHGKKAVIMEPVKGGVLAQIRRRLKETPLHPAGTVTCQYGAPVCGSMVERDRGVSGMSTLEQMQDNVKNMKISGRLRG